jgi:membrane protease YdiL (CAAX protease family)
VSWLNQPAARPNFWWAAHGVRFGWRALLYGLLVVVLLFAVGAVMAQLAGPWLRATLASGLVGPGFVVVNELMLLLPVLGASFALAWLEGVSPVSFGLGGARPVRHVVLGWGSAVIALFVLVLGIVGLGDGRLNAGGQGVLAAARYALLWAGACSLTALAEELCFRGYLQQVLAKGLGFWPAALITSFLFALAHGVNRGEGASGFAMLLAAGLFLAFTLRQTGALWWAIGFHAGWDWGENFLFGTPDSGQICTGTLLHFSAMGAPWLSGGVTGPEGSLLALPALGFGALMLVFSCPRRQGA